MKGTAQILFIGAVSFYCMAGSAQQTPQLQARIKEEAEAGPLYFSFDPDYEAKEEAERVELELLIARIDSLDISQTRKFRLKRELYRNRESKRLKNALEPENTETAEEPH